MRRELAGYYKIIKKLVYLEKVCVDVYVHMCVLASYLGSFS